MGTGVYTDYQHLLRTNWATAKKRTHAGLVVMTRAKKRAQDREEATDRRNKEESGVRPSKVLMDSCEDVILTVR